MVKHYYFRLDNMALFTKLLFVCNFFTFIQRGYGKEIIWTEDKPYDMINVLVPKVIWHQALRPTPVLKSQMTVVVPVHVSDGSENEVEDDIEEEVEESPVVTTIVSEMMQVQNDTNTIISPTISSVTEVPIQDEEFNTPANVQGQVIRFPCSCPDGQCGCCTGAILERFSMKACGNISFIPEDFVFDVRLSVNNRTMVRRRVSASDPPPICFNPRRAPFVRICAEISNIRIRNRNAFACLDMNADIAGFPIYSASFRCFGLGSSGVQTGLKPKPVSSGPKPISLFGSSDSDNDGGLLDNAASAVLGGGDGLFGGSQGGLFGGEGGNDDGGPLDAIGDAVGDIFGGRRI